MDVQRRPLIRNPAFWGILLLAVALRLHGIHNPLLDHPGWRQGDTASIARNFATLQYNILYPQTNYNGPPPNYVELELQIVPFLAASVYKFAGVHEIAGRLLTLAFSVGTVAMLAFFGRRLFASELAGLAAALAFAIMPGSIYYGRTFTPDATMVFFLTAALYAITFMLVERRDSDARWVGASAVLLTVAYWAKPVAVVALVPLLALIAQRIGSRERLRWDAAAIVVIVPLGLLYGYDKIVASHAEWHWASGITTKHVLPAMQASLGNAHALHVKFTQFRQVLGMLGATMIGPPLSALGILGFALLPASTRSRTLLWAWLLGGLAYTYVVVTVERVDYYMFLLLPVAALAVAGFVKRAEDLLAARQLGIRYACVAVALLFAGATAYQSVRIVAPYYRYSRAVYRNAVALDRALAPNALVVMGHYDPSVLYYINRYGWEEDPYLWTPFDEQSAIRKGARYFIAIEKNRFDKNLELCAWMQRFPVLNPNSQWPVYVTDPARVKPGAEKAWRAFRNAEAAGQGRAWLNAHGLCR